MKHAFFFHQVIIVNNDVKDKLNNIIFILADVSTWNISFFPSFLLLYRLAVLKIHADYDLGHTKLRWPEECH